MFRRYQCVRQTDHNDCGPAALATISHHYRRPVDLTRLRSVAGTDAAGTNLIGLVEAAERIGFRAKAVKAPVEALAGIPLPAIAHVRNAKGLGHFVVIHRVDRKRIVVADPERGIVKLSMQEFESQWNGYLLLLAPGENNAAIENDLQGVSASRRFWSLMSGQRRVLFEAAACGILMTLLGLSTSFFIRHLVDSVLVRGESSLLNAMGIGMVTIALFRTFFGAIRRYLLAHVSRRLDMTLLSRFSNHLHRLPIQFFESRQVGDILSRVSDASKVRDAVSGITLTALVDGALVLLTTAFLWFYDPQLAMMAMTFIPVVIILLWLHHGPTKRLSRQSMEESAKFSAHLVEDISGVATIKAFNASEVRTDEADRRVVRMAQAAFGAQKTGISMSSLSGLTGTMASILILWYGGHRVIEGAISIGELMFFHTLLGYMLGPVEGLASIHLEFQEALVAIERLHHVLDAEVEPASPSGAKFTGCQQSIEIKDLCFQYGCREPVLKKVNMTIRAGKTIAIVGESGCGKSTLLKLLSRYYEPTAGGIEVDGIELRDLNLESWRSRLGLVSQDPFIFNGSVRDNITCGQVDADLAQVARAARIAGLDEIISKMPERYNTIIGERGANLSGGQRQRLAIARAVFRDPEIFLFDEATSNLDSATEELVKDNLNSMLNGKTAIIVAHRLSTIQDADYIYVMDQGEIVEEGSHGELCEMNGRYQHLWQVQTGHSERLTFAKRMHGSHGMLAR